MQTTKTPQSYRPSIIRVLIPLILTAVSIMYSWTKFLTTDLIPLWQHYSALIGFLVVVALLIRKQKWGTIALGAYLIIAITTIFSLTYDVSYLSIIFPLGNLTAWGIFIIYVPLNVKALGEYYLDYKESKGEL